MIDLKNRTRETKVYQYPRDVSAGPVRPKPMTVHRGKLHPKTGEKSVREVQITVGGVLTIPPKGELKGLPDALLQHPVLQRDIRGRNVSVRQYEPKAAASPTADASVAQTEGKAGMRKVTPKKDKE